MSEKPDWKRWLGFILCGLVGAFAGYLVTSIALILVLMVGDGFNALFWSIPVTLLSGALLGAWAGLKTLSRLRPSAVFVIALWMVFAFVVYIRWFTRD